MLRDRKIVIAGVDDPGSLGYAVAERALLGGAHVTLTAPASGFAACRDLAERLPYGAHAVRLDLDDPAGAVALRGHLWCAYRRVDGAFAAQAGQLTALARAVAPLLTPDAGALVGLAGDGGATEADRVLAEAGRGAAPTHLVAAGGATERPATADAICFLLGGGATREASAVLAAQPSRDPLAAA